MLARDVETLSYDEEQIEELASLFKALAGVSRIRILGILSAGKVMNAADLAGKMGLSREAARYQLRILEKAHLISSFQGDGAVSYGRVDECACEMIEQGLKHVLERLRWHGGNGAGGSGA